MIVKMQKVTILVLNKYTNEALNALRKLGVVHIKDVHKPVAEGITALEHRIGEIDKALFILGDPKTYQPAESKELEKEKVVEYAREVNHLYAEKEKMRNHLRDLEMELVWFKEWGDVSSFTFSELEKEGVFIKLYVGSKNFLKTISKEKTIQILKEKGGNVYLALISLSKDDCLDLPRINVPDRNLHTLKARIFASKKHIEDINVKVGAMSAHKNCFLSCKEELIKRLEFFKVKFGMAHYTDFSYVQGFCPRRSMPSISYLAEKEGWAYLFEEPDNPEEVPTLLNNPAWINIIAPVLKFMGILPGYGEFDVSICFLLFFSLFCSILVGDAGYGVLFVILAFLLQKKAKAVPMDMVFLIYVLGIGMVIWGAITGTWFGWEGAAKLPLFKSLIVGNLNTWVENNQPMLMRLCFFIGAIHLTVAHMMSAFIKIKSPAVIGELGWIGVVWGMFFYAGYFVLNIPLPVFTNSLILAGAAGVLLFANFQKGFLKSLFATLTALPLTLLAFISTFADVVSYIRLFAVGFASSAISSTFNTLLLGNISGFVKVVIAIVFLIVVHSFNIVLGLVAIFVHGIRLNLLEFSSHSGLQWMGREYKPFRE